MKIIFGLIFVLALSPSSFAHEGHDSPGALPPPPNGGRIGAAENPVHKEKEEHEHKEGEGEEHEDEKEEAELFLEAKLEGTLLKIYPHLLEPERSMVFKSLKPSANLKMEEVKIELPRSKKTYVVGFKVNDDHWEADTGKVKDRRLLIFPTVSEAGTRKTTRIQIEK
jgi:hypothetical protein